MTWKKGDRAKLNRDGRIVNLVDVWAVGLEIFCRTEDVGDGHTSIENVRELRPVT